MFLVKTKYLKIFLRFCSQKLVFTLGIPWEKLQLKHRFFFIDKGYFENVFLVSLLSFV